MNRIGKAAFAASAAAMLGFGAAQAFASPADARAASRSCDPASCQRSCQLTGYSDGVCVTTTKGGTVCFCLF